MKKIFFAFILSMLGLSASAADWPNIARYDSLNQVVRQLPAEQRRVVFFGNSITEGWPKAHPEFFSGNGFVGRGISGQTTYQFLVRFRGDAIELQPQVIVVNAATNDVAENTHPYNEDRSFANIVSLVQLTQANGIQPVMSTVLPAAGFSWNKSITDSSDKIESLNRRLEEYAKANGIPFIDYYSALVSPDGSRAMNPAYTKDGVHPTADGYTVMEKCALDVILPLLK